VEKQLQSKILKQQIIFQLFPRESHNAFYDFVSKG
jgi:hypothetical protein